MKEKELQSKSIIKPPSSSGGVGWKKGFFNKDKKVIKNIDKEIIQPKINISPPLIEPVMKKQSNPIKIFKPSNLLAKQKDPIEKEIETNPLVESGSRFSRGIKNKNNDERMTHPPNRPVAFSGNIVERGFP
jgi:hypothetical protein